jgi:glycosyltransferase involved in cell wall biosynthesis
MNNVVALPKIEVTPPKFGEFPLRSQNAVITRFPSTPQQTATALPKVAILLCTYHGQKYLVDQLESFAAQTHTNWELWVSDDGSKDDTHAILEDYRNKWGAHRISIHSGPAEGFVANFLSLTCHADIQADCYAYSDQDDIWKEDKLKRAVEWLKSVPKDVPGLYCSRTRLVDSKNQHIGFSPLFSKPPSFANALMQNVGGGNTMVFNEAARRLLCEAGKDVDVITHDWWAYLLISGCGGRVFYDSSASVRYRQHSCNLVGMNSSWPARLVRIRMLWQGRFKRLNDQHINELRRLRSILTPQNQQILDQFAHAREQWMVPRLLGLKKSGIYRQTLLGNLGLIFAAVFKKI